MKRSTLKRYDSYNLFEGYPEPHPQVGCANCGRTIPDDRRPMWQDDETQLIYCCKKCADHNHADVRINTEKQVSFFAVLAAKDFGYVNWTPLG